MQLLGEANGRDPALGGVGMSFPRETQELVDGQLHDRDEIAERPLANFATTGNGEIPPLANLLVNPVIAVDATTLPAL